MIAKAFVYFIKAYQFLSRALQLKTCRFYPSCSQYAVDAIQKHGALKGGLMAAGRMVRCSPLSAGGYDPVR